MERDNCRGCGNREMLLDKNGMCSMCDTILSNVYSDGKYTDEHIRMFKEDLVMGNARRYWNDI